MSPEEYEHALNVKPTLMDESDGVEVVSLLPQAALQQLTEDEGAAEVAELYARCEQAEVMCQNAAFLVAKARDELKEAKETYSASVAELRRCARARREKNPLFDGTPIVDGEPPKLAVAEDDWRETPIERILEGEGYIRKLMDAGVETAGQLQAAMRADPDGWWKDFKGIGRESATAIEDQFNEYVGEVEEPEEED